MNEPTDPKQLDMTQLRNKVWSQPTTKDLRPYIVEYLHREIDRARTFTNYELLHGKGWDVASNICGALAWQGADGVEGDDWANEESEPELDRALQVSGKLDIDANDQAAWDELFEIVERL